MWRGPPPKATVEGPAAPGRVDGRTGAGRGVAVRMATSLADIRPAPDEDFVTASGDAALALPAGVHRDAVDGQRHAGVEDRAFAVGGTERVWDGFG